MGRVANLLATQSEYEKVPVSVDARAHNHGDDIGIAAAQLVVDVATEILHVRVVETWEHR